MNFPGAVTISKKSSESTIFFPPIAFVMVTILLLYVILSLVISNGKLYKLHAIASVSTTVSGAPSVLVQ